MLETVLQDIRFAARKLATDAVFSTTVILSLALAIGANTALYSIIDSAMLRPLPVVHPLELVRLAAPAMEEPGGGPPEQDTFSYPMYLAFREAAGQSANLALFSAVEQTEARLANADAASDKVALQYISGSAFEMLGIRPAAGQLLSGLQDAIGGEPLAVISYDYWRRGFHSDRSVVGRFLEVGQKTYRIEGIAAEGFFGIEPGKFVDVWLPSGAYTPKALRNEGWEWCRILGRLAPANSAQQLSTRLQPAFHDSRVRFVQNFPTMPPAVRRQFYGMKIRVHPASTGVSEFRSAFGGPLWIVLAVAAGILLIACSNVASLMVARLSNRSAEMALRTALGASRVRLLRQLMTESLLLSFTAGALGWFLAGLTEPLIPVWLSTSTDAVRLSFATNTRVLLFSVAVSIAAAVLFGLLPAWQSAGNPISAIRAAAHQSSRLRSGRVFVGIQIAFAFCLVVTGLAFMASLRNLGAVNLGFDTHDVTVLALTSEGARIPKPQQLRYMEELRQRAASWPGVRGATIALSAIFGVSDWAEQVQTPGMPISEREERFYGVSPGYFAALHARLLAGREFDARDIAAGNPTPAIVNEAFAKRYFPGGRAVGMQFVRPAQDVPSRCVVVGLASDVRTSDVRKRAEPAVYLPYVGSDNFTLYLRSALGPAALRRMMDQELGAMHWRVRVRDVSTLETVMNDTILRERLLARLGGVFAFFGLLLAAGGLFGLLDYAVSRRTKEIGVRAALGACRSELVLLIMRDMSLLIGVALLCGVTIAFAALTLLQSVLFGIPALDPRILFGACAIFLAALTMAAAVPACRVATVDINGALRYE